MIQNLKTNCFVPFLWRFSWDWTNSFHISISFPGGASGEELTCQCRRQKRPRFNPWVEKIPWRRARQPPPVFLPGESPWTEEPLSMHAHMSSWKSTHEFLILNIFASHISQLECHSGSGFSSTDSFHSVNWLRLKQFPSWG